MTDGRGSAVEAGLAAALVAIGLIASFSLPPSFLLSSASQPQTTVVSADGRLNVSVLLRDVSGNLFPMAEVGVGVTQFVVHGLRLVFNTDSKGNVSTQASPGEYGVSIADPRFTLSTRVTVFSGSTTQLRVIVNRTSANADFAQVQDSTTSEQVGPWNQLVVEVTPSPLAFPFGLWALGQYTIFVQNMSSNAVPKFGSEVFLQPLEFSGGLGRLSPLGAEVPASVVAQMRGEQTVWLTLRPLEILDLSGSYFLSVVTYTAGSSVSIRNG